MRRQIARPACAAMRSHAAPGHRPLPARAAERRPSSSRSSGSEPRRVGLARGTTTSASTGTASPASRAARVVAVDYLVRDAAGNVVVAERADRRTSDDRSEHIPCPAARRRIHGRSLARGRARRAARLDAAAVRRRPPAPSRPLVPAAGCAPACRSRSARASRRSLAAVGHPRLRGLGRPRRGQRALRRPRPRAPSRRPTFAAAPDDGLDLARPARRRERASSGPSPSRARGCAPARARAPSCMSTAAGRAWPSPPSPPAGRTAGRGDREGDGRALRDGAERAAGARTAISSTASSRPSRPARRRAPSSTAAGVHRVAASARDAVGNPALGAGAPATWSGSTKRRPGSPSPPAEDPAEPERIEAIVADSLSGPDPSRGSIGVRPRAAGQPFAPLPTVVASRLLDAVWDSDSYPPGQLRVRGDRLRRGRQPHRRRSARRAARRWCSSAR